jgi:hypothetical protein
VALAVLAIVGLVSYSLYRHVDRISVPDDLVTDEQHFKYGSIGSDAQGAGLPYWIWRAMPEVCPDLLPGGYASLGLIQETGMDRPVGFSRRRTGLVDSVGLNCAVCHTASVRDSPEAPPRHYAGATSHQLDLWGYFNFVLSCAQDPRFTPDTVVPILRRMTDLSLLDRLVYRLAVTQTRKASATRAAKVAWIRQRPSWGPGRVDTFNPYKTLLFDLDMSNDSSIGTADFMTIWNQKLRDGLWVHWDGNNDSVAERNFSAALGAGATPASLDLPRIERIRSWIWSLKPPAYPYDIDHGLARTGRPLYEHHCAGCHEPGGADFGKVSPAASVGTDPERTRAFDPAMAGYMNRIGAGYPWQFSHFRITGGYVNGPLDGAWLRAPYLHNGSVPSLRDLLDKADRRPATFYKGNDLFDRKRVGYVSTMPTANGQSLFEFDTRLRGNGNSGHVYGTDLSDAEKDALVEYLKTL